MEKKYLEEKSFSLKKKENPPFFFLLTHNPSTVWNFTKTFFSKIFLCSKKLILNLDIFMRLFPKKID